MRIGHKFMLYGNFFTLAEITNMATARHPNVFSDKINGARARILTSSQCKLNTEINVQTVCTDLLICIDLYLLYRTTIFPCILYGCETWSLILREES